MSGQKVAIVIGVGAQRGLGAQLCLRFAREGHHVFVAGRTPSKLEHIVGLVAAAGGNATAFPADATREADVQALFDAACAHGAVDLAVYNVGNNRPGRIAAMDTEYFEESWRLCCLGGFLFGREAARRLLPAGASVIFTAASASLRGRPGFGAFSAGKGALRNFAQALAKECGADGLHVGHVIIDGGIAGERLFSRRPEIVSDGRIDQFVDLAGLTDAYWFLYQQPQQAWTFELDCRTSLENW